MADDFRDLRCKAAQTKAIALDVDGVLTDGRLHIDEQGCEHKIFHSRDGHGIKMLQKLGVEVAIITGRSSPAVLKRAEGLGIKHVILNCTTKGEAIEQLSETLNQPLKHIAAMGDDLIDLPMLNRAGLAATVPEAPAIIRACCDWTSPLPGGQGAVRALIDLIITARGDWPTVLEQHR
ncbi:MAG TPA: HAD-IIIA family hydrolase [Halothiobacillaceae bacterium]|nr:HAD-IIIA family hydrolase [Halothiobacillaceae bacterium]